MAKSPTDIVRPHALAAAEEGLKAGLALDQVGRALLDQAIELLLKEQAPEAVASELEFVARNLGDEEDNSFMRP
ncbi:MAG: hypothetical protein KDC18_08805 [Alphaproteobacteria bacterium]|nr:hypothetical protein [Alphaproteobacteria bacterium]MCB9931640.1 hypothetical protein [Alphaproteobacteria bacterium]